MSRWSARRGQVEPLAAIVAVFAVSVGLAVYAGALDTALPETRERSVADTTIDSVTASVEHNGVVDPVQLQTTATERPDGYRLNVTVTADDQRWHVGPLPPETAQRATEQVSVRVAPTRVRPGWIVVRVWR